MFLRTGTIRRLPVLNVCCIKADPPQNEIKEIKEIEEIKQIIYDHPPQNEIKESVNDKIDVLHPARVEPAPALIIRSWWQTGEDHLQRQRKSF